MKKIFFAVLVTFCFACQSDKKQSKEQTTTEISEKPDKEELSILEKVANAYGYENWSKVEQVNFSFVVNPGEEEMLRQWSWYPQQDRVTLIKDNEKISYDRKNVMEEFVKTDKAFVNDSFWLLFPFHLVWDDVDYESIDNVKSPIQQKESTKLIVKYPEEGGYTPGDTYEVYLNENHHILEWTYHPAGQKEPALVNTFEDLSNFDGIKVNVIHRNPDTGFQLNFREVSFK